MTAWSFVQATSAGGTTGSLSKAFASNVTKGNLLVAIATSYYGILNHTIDFAISDSQGNIWVPVSRPLITNNTDYLQMFITQQGANSTGANTVTISTQGIDLAYKGLAIAEFSNSGSPTSYAADGSVTNTGTSASPTSGSIPVNGSDELALAGFTQGSGTRTWAAGTGFTNAAAQTNGTSNMSAYLDYALGVATAQTDNATFGSSAHYSAMSVSIRGIVSAPSSLIPGDMPWGQQKPPFGTPINPSHPLSQGLVGAWIMNEGGSGTLYNLASNIANGAIQSGTTWNTDIYGAALSFNNTTSAYVDCGNNYAGLSALTAVSFFTPTSAGAQSPVLIGKGMGTVGNREWGLEVSNNTLYGQIAHEGGSVFNLPGVKTFTAGQRVCGVLTWDGATEKLYFNGVLDASMAASTTIVAGTAHLKIGRDENSGDFLNGKQSMCLLYNRALSAAEIKILYAQPFAFMQPRTLWLPGGLGAASTFQPAWAARHSLVNGGLAA